MMQEEIQSQYPWFLLQFPLSPSSPFLSEKKSLGKILKTICLKDVYSETETCILKDFGAGLASRRHIQGVQSSSSRKVRKSLTWIYEAIYKMIKISNFIKKMCSR